ncbi:MAG: bifunctional demethylmenaquinone methyltransferase/2-methoxy-6-polyprenyl-1,4-benzoquinol methylase UbiE [Polyangiales bacterium]
MFDAIADRYDMLNRVLSMGIDRRWREEAVAAIALDESDQSNRCGQVEGEVHVLDVATGTGDLAIAIARKHPSAHVVGVDPSPKMLAVAERKASVAALQHRVTFREGDAQCLAFEQGTFDGVAIAFGIRNVPDRKRALRELARVTRRRGRIVVLELSEPPRSVIGALSRFHIHTVVPWVGATLSGAAEYRYLERSIAAFPRRDAFVATMNECGLTVLRATPLTFGVSTLFVAEKR